MRKIQTDEQMYQTLEAIQLLYRGLASLKARVLPLNPKNYAILAEGPVDTIRELQAQIDEYFRVDLVGVAEEHKHPRKGSGGESKAGSGHARLRPIRS